MLSGCNCDTIRIMLSVKDDTTVAMIGAGVYLVLIIVFFLLRSFIISFLIEITFSCCNCNTIRIMLSVKDDTTVAMIGAGVYLVLIIVFFLLQLQSFIISFLIEIMFCGLIVIQLELCLVLKMT